MQVLQYFWDAVWCLVEVLAYNRWHVFRYLGSMLVYFVWGGPQFECLVSNPWVPSSPISVLAEVWRIRVAASL